MGGIVAAAATAEGVIAVEIGVVETAVVAVVTVKEAAIVAVAVEIAGQGAKNSNPCGGLESLQGFFVAAKLLL